MTCGHKRRYNIKQLIETSLLLVLDHHTQILKSLFQGFGVSAVVFLILPATPLSFAVHQYPAEHNSTPQSSPLLMCTTRPHCLTTYCQIWSKKKNKHTSWNFTGKFLNTPLYFLTGCTDMHRDQQTKSAQISAMHSQHRQWVQDLGCQMSHSFINFG